MNSNYPAVERKTFATADDLLREKENKPGSAVSRILLISTGFSLILWACSSGTFRIGENILNAKLCLPLAFGLAFITIGGFINTALKTFGFWLSLALVGQAVSLQMINAGKLIHFQHYRSLTELLGQDIFLLIVLVFQAVLVAFGVGRRRLAITKWLGENFKPWQLILIIVFLILASAAVTREVSIYVTSLIFAAAVQLINLANIVLVAWSIPRESHGWLRERLESFFAAKESEKTSLDKFSMLAALWVIVLAGGLSYFVYQAHPSVPDEVQYIFQAKHFAAGQLTATAPSVPEAFSMYMMPHAEGEWFAIFPPGWAALLAIGVKLNIVWLINPLLGGLCILLTYLFLQEIYSRRIARISILLLCCSPWFVFMAMSLMSHMFTLACALTAGVLLQLAIMSGKMIYVFAAGLAIGMVSLIRPLDGVIVAAALGLSTLHGFETWKKKLTGGAVLGVGTMIIGALIFPYNRMITGSATLSPSDAYYTKYFWEGACSLGFGANRGMNWGLDAFPGHSPLEAVVNIALNVFLLNTELFGWGAGSLFLVICFVLSGSIGKNDFWALGLSGIIVAAYSLFWYHGGPDFGARYWFLSIVPFVALTARAIERLSVKTAPTSEPQLNPRLVSAVAMLCILSLLNYFPWRALDKYYHYLGMEPGIAKLAQEHHFGKSLVLIRGEEHPDYQSAWIYNPLNFEGDAPLYAHDKSPEIRSQLLKAYRGRPVWIVDGPTRTGSGYKIVQGPLNNDESSLEKTH
jgi:4-amino-4-deoxy-L-arabinose transferase-like glycosyltransferase